MARERFELTINGQAHEVFVEARKLLSDVIREDCLLTGTHVGCEHGVCGACTIHLDGEPARACLTYVAQAAGRQITTIESISRHGRLSVLQQAMHDEHALQCGFCTAGIIMTFEAYLRENPNPDEDQIREVLSGNLCRCTGYQNIVLAIRQAARVLTGLEDGR